MTEQRRARIENIDWSAVNRLSFISGRDVSSDSNEMTVLRRGDLSFVIKVPQDVTGLTGYELAEKLSGLVAQTVLVSNLEIVIDWKKKTLDRCVIQEKVSPLWDDIAALAKKGDVQTIVGLIEEKAALDREIFARGVFVPDPKFPNYGKGEDKKVVLLDLGSAVEDPTQGDDGQFIRRLLLRGMGHYGNLAYLSLIPNAPPGLRPQLAQAYRRTTGLDFNPNFSTQTFTNLGNYLHLQVSRFGDLFLLIAQQELERFFPTPIRQHQLVTRVLAGEHLQWAVSADGTIVVY